MHLDETPLELDRGLPRGETQDGMRFLLHEPGDDLRREAARLPAVRLDDDFHGLIVAKMGNVQKYHLFRNLSLMCVTQIHPKAAF